jgi:ADP-heptose:LPS heptosyltransferase
VRALPGLGDMLCAVPALRALRRAFPSAEVTLVGLEGSTWFVDRFDAYVDALLPCPVWPGLTEIDGPRRLAAPFVARARRRRFDVAVQLHGDGGASNVLTAALGAATWVGLAADGPGVRPPNGTVGAYRSDRHEIDRCLDAVALLGVDTADSALEFPLRDDDVRASDHVVGSATSFAVVHPGSSRAATRWTPLGFARVVDHLLGHVERVLLTGGRADGESTAAVHAIAADPGRVVDLAGATSIGELAALVHRAAVVVANDTGAAHLARAVGVPSVTVCGPSDVVRWGSRGPLERVVGGVPHGRWPSVHEVRGAVDGLLARREEIRS